MRSNAGSHRFEKAEALKRYVTENRTVPVTKEYTVRVNNGEPQRETENRPMSPHCHGLGYVFESPSGVYGTE